MTKIASSAIEAIEALPSIRISFRIEAQEFQRYFCFEALKSTKISSHETVSSQKYENGYRTKICDFTVWRRLEDFSKDR